jgi:hypothetical protein
MSDYIPEDEADDSADYPATYLVSDLPPDFSVTREREFSATRNRLAMAIWIPYALIAVLIIAGGLAGKFGPEVVDPVVAAYAASATAVAYFFFRGRSPYRAQLLHDCNCCHHHKH